MADQNEVDILPMDNYFRQLKQSVQKYLNDLYQSKTDNKLFNLKDQMNINDNYSIDIKVFEKTILPQIIKWATNGSTIRDTSILLLQLILFNEWKNGKTQMTKISLKASLIQKLISINETTNDTEIKELVLSFHLFLCFVVSDDKKVKNDLLLKDKLLIESTIRNLETLNNENLIKDSLIVLQLYIYNTKHFETLSPVLQILIKFMNQSNSVVVSQTCYTLLVFSQSFREARQALMDSKIGVKLIDIWKKYENEKQIVKPVFAIFKVLLPRFNDYKNQFLSKELNILEIIPLLVKSSLEENRVYASEMVKLIAMRPLSAKHYPSTEQIKTLIKFKVIESINNLVQFDDSPAVKSSALEAIFVIAYNSINSIDIIKSLAEQGTIEALCSQMESNDPYIHRMIVFSLSVFLVEEFKDILKTKYYFAIPKRPNDPLTPFVTKIRDSNAFNHLSRFNRERIEKENKLNKHLPEWSLQKDGYKLSDTERMIEEIMVHSFGVETRPERRKPSKEVMAAKETTPHAIACVHPDCGFRKASRDIFSCNHAAYCPKCASSAVHKIFLGDIKKCPYDNCDKTVAASDTPFYLFKEKLFKEYQAQQTKVETQIETKVYK